MTPTPTSSSGAKARQTVEQAKPQGAAGPFVLNLCSSTTPMALSNPEQPELKRFSFFVSRRFEEGRERFRLHMGYFQTLKEAEEWLGAVRDIYPGAWAGEAPGKKLRERAVAAAAAQAQHAAGPPPHLNVPTVHAAAPAPNSNALNVPLAKPAPGAAHSASAVTHQHPPVPTPAKTPSSANTTAATPKGPSEIVRAALASNVAAHADTHALRAVPAAPAPAAQARLGGARPATTAGVRPLAVATSGATRNVPVAVPVAAPAKALQQSAKAAPQGTHTSHGQHGAPASLGPHGAHGSQATQGSGSSGHPPAAAPAPSARAQSTSAARPNSKGGARAALPNSNVREVLKALEETPAETEVTGETRMMPAPVLASLDASSDTNSFTDTQVLKYLETRRADGTEITGVDVESGAISLLKPDDTGTRRALKEAIADNAPVWFAVQLQWSVQPVELSKVPPLAIFSAYTLYTVEGSRDGRKWYGLRLGFFSDAISAKQVAYYVRSEFTSVAVVPVSPQERSRASEVDKKAELAFPKKTRSEPVDEFKLIDSDDQPLPKPQPVAAPKPAAAAKTAPPGAAAGRRAPKANGRVRAREHRTPQTLEETLEILGAGELEMDTGNGATVNESGVRHLRVEVQKNTPFGRLLERLSERVRKP